MTDAQRREYSLVYLLRDNAGAEGRRQFRDRIKSHRLKRKRESAQTRNNSSNSSSSGHCDINGTSMKTEEGADAAGNDTEVAEDSEDLAYDDLVFNEDNLAIRRIMWASGDALPVHRDTAAYVQRHVQVSECKGICIRIPLPSHYSP